MKVLALDTATERCSVALRVDGVCVSREVDTQRGHADLILPLVETVLHESRVSLGELDVIAYGRGPGAFTGVRIAVSVAQGLAYASSLPTVGISNLAAVAQQCADSPGIILVCMDARMGEVYWGTFVRGAHGFVEPLSNEHVTPPGLVAAEDVQIAVGTGFRAYTELTERYAHVQRRPDLLPRAAEIAWLGEHAFAAGLAQPAQEARPVYLRDQVAFVKSK